MKMITGYLAPDAGRISICGNDVETNLIAAQTMLGYLPEGAPAYGDMTARQFLRFIAGVRGLRGDAAKAAIANTVGKTELAPVLDRPIETLSKGFKRRVGLAQAILHDPPVLIMDEPTDGLDPNQKHSVRTLLKAMAPHKAIIVSTHLLEEVEAVCTRAVINRSRRDCPPTGKPSELLARSRYHNAVTMQIRPIKPQRRSPRSSCSPASRPSTGLAGRRHSAVYRVSESGALLIEDVSALAVREKWNVKELYAEAGRLDEVFRSITTHDARAREGGGMSQVWQIFKREFAAYFATPLAYVFIVIFLFAMGAFTFYIGRFYDNGVADLGVFLLLSSLGSICSWFPASPCGCGRRSADGHDGASVHASGAALATVLGKYLAAWPFTAVALALTFPIWITVNYLGSPDNGVILAGYIGSLLMAGSYLAIGACLFGHDQQSGPSPSS